MKTSASSTPERERPAQRRHPAPAPTLPTELPSDCHPDLDQYPVPELVNAFVDDQWHALGAVRAASAQIAQAVAEAVPRIAGGGRLVYVGAGTSGRLGVLDSVELYPTFSWPRSRAIALLAGGQQAMFEAVEGAEDSLEQGRLDLAAVALRPDDVVILLAASGATPYVMGALEAARAAGALTIGIANNPAAPVTLGADIAITLNTGSEVISGSTRLKAGTSQKIALNTLSSAIMVRLNKVYGNLMVDLQPTNAKLFRRAISLTMRATGANEDTARQTLAASENQVKVAIVSILKKIGVKEAAARLAAAHGSVRAAIAEDG
jgi:N-acetylmuramic acid 6-phosphate etherase